MSLKLYYTGGKSPGVSQKDPSLSLGAYISTQAVPNGRVSNIFGAISSLSLQKNKSQVIGLMCKNEGESSVSNIGLWFTNIPTGYILKLAVTAVTADLYMESIVDRYALPFESEFYEATVDSPLIISNALAAGDAFGIWIQISLSNSIIKTDDELYTLFHDGGSEGEGVAEYNLVIDTDVEQPTTTTTTTATTT